MAEAVEASPNRADEIVSRLLELSNDPHNGKWDVDESDDNEFDGGSGFYGGSVREEAIRQMADSLGHCPVKSEEVFALVLRECINENPHIREAAVSQLGGLTAICPDKSAQIIPVILERCEDEDRATKLTATMQLAKAAVACHERVEVLVQKLLRSCGSDDRKVKELAMAGLAQAAKGSRAKVRHITRVLIWGCANEDETLRSAAKENLELALRVHPEEAADIVARLVQKQSREEMHAAERNNNKPSLAIADK